MIQAARNGHAEVLLGLLSAGAVINDLDLMFHHSALMVAALNGHGKSAGLLLDAGADPMLKRLLRKIGFIACCNQQSSVGCNSAFGRWTKRGSKRFQR